jgi:hypothetical protein
VCSLDGTLNWTTVQTFDGNAGKALRQSLRLPASGVVQVNSGHPAADPILDTSVTMPDEVKRRHGVLTSSGNVFATAWIGACQSPLG